MSPRIARFQWDEANLSQIALHLVTRSEVEEAFLDERALLEGDRTVGGEPGYRMPGAGSDGRVLSVVFVQVPSERSRLSAPRAVCWRDTSGRQQVKNEIEVPAFRSEAEEADWWYANRESDDERMIRAMDDGSALRVVDVLFDHGLTLEGLKQVVVPVQEGDVELAMEGAVQAGMNFREYMGKVLHEALSGRRAA